MATATAESPDPARSRHWALWWMLVIGLAVGLRIWMWSFQARSGAVPPGDPEEYYRAALHILQGGYHDTGKWLRPPLYPALLAFCFALVGPNLTTTLLAQAVLSGLAVPAFGWLALRLFGSQPIALLAGLLAALFVPLASFGSALFAEGLFVVLIIAALAALDRAIAHYTWRAALIAGLLLGLAALTRAVAVSFIPIAGLLLFFLARPHTQVSKTAPKLLHSRIWLLIGLLAGATFVIGPWAIRNAIVHQRLILSDTNGGISLWYGVIRSDAEQQAGEAQLWAIPNLADRQSLALRWAAARIAEDPLWFVGRMRFKIASLYLLQIRNYAVGDIITIDPHDQLVAMGAGENPQSWSAIADTEYVVIMLAAIAGMCFKTNRRRLIPVLIWVLFATFMSAITIGHLRLRLPIVAALIPCAAYGLTLLYTALTSRHSKQVAVPGDRVRSDRPAARHTWPWAVLMLAGWLLFFGLIFSTRYLTWARSWSALYQANTAIAAQQFGRAQSQLERARAIDPNNPLRTMDLADLAFQTGNTEQALELYTQTLQLEDRNLYAHAMRSRIAALLGKAAIAANDQAALAGYGRDTNEVYSWAWDTFNDPPVTRVVPGDPNALGRFVGFAPATPDLTSGRWTLGEAKIRLQDSCGTLILRVRGPNGRSVAVAVADRAAAHIFELTGSEQELRIPLTCTPGTVLANQSIVVDLKSATSLIDLEHSPWYGGIIVLEARIT